MKKILIIIILSLLINGCSTNNPKLVTKPITASEIINSLSDDYFEYYNLDTENTYADKSIFDTENNSISLPFATREDYDNIVTTYNTILTELEQLDTQSLTNLELSTYKTLKDYLQRNIKLYNYYEYDVNYLGTNNSLISRLPFLLDSFELKSESLNQYCELLESSTTIFKQYYELELERQAIGAGLSKKSLQQTIALCNNIAYTELLKIKDNKINQFNQQSFISKLFHINFEDKLYDAFNTLQKSYIQLANDLQSIDTQNNLGLPNSQTGKSYYETLLAAKTGIDTDITAIKSYLETKLTTVGNNYDKLALIYPNQAASFDTNSIKFTTATTYKQIIEEQKNYSKQYVPTIADFKYDVLVSNLNSQNNNASAFYVISNRNDTPNYVEKIYVNENSSNQIYVTLVHEGYPGHMYQNKYFQLINYPEVMYQLSYSGYQEGWATYIENIGISFSVVDDPISLEFYKLNNDYGHCVYALADIYVNYDGYTYQQLYDRFHKYFPVNTEEVLTSIYASVLANPTNFPQYYLTGFYFQDLYDYYKSLLQSDFNPIEFHKVILDSGPTSFAIIEENLNNYYGY